MLAIDFAPNGDVVIAGRLDATQSPTAQAFLDQVQGTVRLDCSGLEYISSAGLRVLLASAKQFRKLQGAIGLTSLTPTVKQVFEISGFTSIFPIYASREEALGAMK